ncbi:DUF378 domain-containing protein [Alkaliphilus transvaalensis]|uniref:DUF378 domain-containing protein n=1 Tax=Alkaliphilus transvaalensis TaxID=114628 RepID=UPI00054FAA44|nr:DUF378 domain-containing protein [Alkaliphilus transvaalensis]
MLAWIAVILIIIGGLNWGLVGLFNVDVVASIFGGSRNPVARLVYILIGVAALYTLLMLFLR